MKRIYVVTLIVIALAIFLPFAAYAQSPTPVSAPAPITLPQAVIALITLGVSYLVTQGLKSVSILIHNVSWLGWIPEISGWGSWITGFIVTGVVFYLNYGLTFLPVSFNPVVVMILNALVFIFGANGVHATVARLSPNKVTTSNQVKR